MATKDKKEFQKFADITAAMKAEFKAKHGSATVVSFPVDEDVIEGGEEAQFIIIPPSRDVVEAVTKYAEEKDYTRANNVMIKNCVLGGDMQYLDKEEGIDRIYYGLMKTIGDSIKAKKVTVKKL